MVFKSVHVQHAIVLCMHQHIQTSAHHTWKQPLGAFLHKAEFNLIEVTLKTLQYLNILCIVYGIWLGLFLAEKLDGTEVFKAR